jgi:pyrimidine operon attenuation protein/uracil phosphoribosyltransferase
VSTLTSVGALLLDAEALYRELLRGVQQISGANTRLVGITSGGAWLAERLQRDMNLPGKPAKFRRSMHRDDFAQRGLSSRWPDRAAL